MTLVELIKLADKKNVVVDAHIPIKLLKSLTINGTGFLRIEPH
jgi:hypothetical protein